MYQKWLKYFLVYVLLLASVFISFNLICDPYGIFDINWYGNRIRNAIASDRMSKVYYAKRLMPETVLIGTSRTALINTRDVSRYTHDKVYNMALDGSSLYEQAMYARFAIETLHVKRVLWGIDFFSLNPLRYPDSAFDKNRLVPGIYFNDYQGALLSLSAFGDSFQTLIQSFQSRSAEKINLTSGSETYFDAMRLLQRDGIKYVQTKIERGLEGYAKTKTLFNAPEFQNPHSIDASLNFLKETLALSKEKNVEIIVYMSPVYYRHLELIDQKNLTATYRYFKDSIAELTPYWDFNTRNSVTLDINHFWDNSHIRQEIAQRMMQKIFEHTPLDDDFGTYRFRER